MGKEFAELGSKRRIKYHRLARERQSENENHEEDSATRTTRRTTRSRNIETGTRRSPDAPQSY